MHSDTRLYFWAVAMDSFIRLCTGGSDSLDVLKVCDFTHIAIMGFLV